MKFQVHAQITFRDIKTGKIIRKTRKKLCNSYLANLINLLWSMMGNQSQSLTDTSNAAKTALYGSATAGTYAMFAAAGASDTTYGIVAGTGSGAVAITDYKLGTLILHGTTSTKLSYGAVSIGACATVSTTRQFTIARTLTNLSGSDITVNEIGLYIRCQDTGAGQIYLCIERSLLTFTITNGTSGTVTYTISATV